MEIIVLLVTLAVLYFVSRWVGAGASGIVWLIISRVQQRTALRRTTFARYEPMDIAKALVSLGLGVLVFWWIFGVKTAPPPVFHALPPQNAPIGDRPAGDGPETYRAFFPGVTVSLAAPPFPALSPDTLWVPLVTTGRQGRVRGGAAGVLGDQRLECGYDLTRIGAPLRCFLWVVAPVEDGFVPVIRLDFDAGGVAAHGLNSGLKLEFGAGDERSPAADGVLRWRWAEIGDRPRRAKAITLHRGEEERRIALGDIALLAARVIDADEAGRLADEDFEWRDKNRSARVYRHWGAGAPDCLASPFFTYWSGQTESRWSNLASGEPPERSRDGFFTDLPPGALGDRCAAAGFALAYIDRLHIR